GRAPRRAPPGRPRRLPPPAQAPTRIPAAPLPRRRGGPGSRARARRSPSRARPAASDHRGLRTDGAPARRPRAAPPPRGGAVRVSLARVDRARGVAGAGLGAHDALRARQVQPPLHRSRAEGRGDRRARRGAGRAEGGGKGSSVRAAFAGAAATALLVVALVVGGASTERLLQAYVFVLGTLTLGVLVHAARPPDAPARAVSAFELALRPRRASEERLAALRQVERVVALGLANSAYLH